MKSLHFSFLPLLSSPHLYSITLLTLSPVLLSHYYWLRLLCFLPGIGCSILFYLADVAFSARTAPVLVSYSKENNGIDGKMRRQTRMIIESPHVPLPLLLFGNYSVTDICIYGLAYLFLYHIPFLATLHYLIWQPSLSSHPPLHSLLLYTVVKLQGDFTFIQAAKVKDYVNQLHLSAPPSAISASNK